MNLQTRNQLIDLLAEAELRWSLKARTPQLPPHGDDWFIWLFLAGRGAGKTRAGAEWLKDNIQSGIMSRIALVAPTAGDARDIMIEGDSGLLSLNWRSEFEPKYEPSKRRITFPNGASMHVYTAEEPNRLRGPQHDGAWCDEIASWKYVEDTWDNLMFGLRLGQHPRVCVTTTPRPIKIIKDFKKRDGDDVAITFSTTYDNFKNLAPTFREQIVKKYEGTRLGRQELLAEILEDVEGALWTQKLIDDNRVDIHPDLVRVIVAVDPSGGGGDEQGIVVAGKGVDGHGYLIADLSCSLSPDGWGQRSVNAYHHYQADMLVAESNYGGNMVENVIKTIDRTVNYKSLHASRGKIVRAEPIAALDEQKRIHHVGSFEILEEQMTTYVPENFDGSPDRMDARVWAFTELMLDSREFKIW